MLAVAWIMAHALAVPLARQQRFCLHVDVEFNDDGWGDRWADNSVDRPARGFRVRVYRELNPGLQLVWEGNVDDGDPDGCTPFVNLQYDPFAPNDYTYRVRAYSYDAFVNGNVVGAFSDVPPMPDEPSPSDGAMVDVLTDHRAIGNLVAVYPPPIPAHVVEPRFNVLAFATFALYMHDANMDDTYRFQVGSSGAAGSAWGVHLSAPKRSVYSHETGHAVSMKRGGNPNGNKFADHDNCLGDASDPNDPNNLPPNYAHLQKEWNSQAAREGIADYYGYITWNEVFSGADCEWGHHHRSDWDNDGIVDTPASAPYDCIGLPEPGVLFADENDWLANLIPAPDTKGCGGDSTMEDVGTIYDWSRYFFAMVTNPYDRGSPHTIAQMWNVWEDAHPGNWLPEGVSNTVDPDEPAARLEDAAFSMLGANNNHDEAAAQYGLDH